MSFRRASYLDSTCGYSLLCCWIDFTTRATESSSVKLARSLFCDETNASRYVEETYAESALKTSLPLIRLYTSSPDCLRQPVRQVSIIAKISSSLIANQRWFVFESSKPVPTRFWSGAAWRVLGLVFLCFGSQMAPNV